MRTNWMGFLAIVALSLIGAAPAAAQSAYLEEGQYGALFGALLAHGDGYDGFGGGLAFGVDGTVDLGLTVSRLAYDEARYGGEFHELTVSPSFNAILLRPRAEAPIGLEFGGSFALSSYSGDGLDSQGVDMSGHLVQIGGDLFFEIESSGLNVVYPKVGAAYVAGEIKVVESNGNAGTSDFGDLAYLFGLDLLMNRRYVIGFSAVHLPGSTSFSLSLSLLSHLR